MSKSREEMIEELIEWQTEEDAAGLEMANPKFVETEPEKYITVTLPSKHSTASPKFEHWKGGSFIRIHRQGCIHSESQRIVDPDCENAMFLDGTYETLGQAESAAEQKVSRWKKCLRCC